eukprot:g16255.t1
MKGTFYLANRWFHPPQHQWVPEQLQDKWGWANKTLAGYNADVQPWRDTTTPDDVSEGGSWHEIGFHTYSHWLGKDLHSTPKIQREFVDNLVEMNKHLKLGVRFPQNGWGRGKEFCELSEEAKQLTAGGGAFGSGVEGSRGGASSTASMLELDQGGKNQGKSGSGVVVDSGSSSAVDEQYECPGRWGPRDKGDLAERVGGGRPSASSLHFSWPYGKVTETGKAVARGVYRSARGTKCEEMDIDWVDGEGLAGLDWMQLPACEWSDAFKKSQSREEWQQRKLANAVKITDEENVFSPSNQNGRWLIGYGHGVQSCEILGPGPGTIGDETERGAPLGGSMGPIIADHHEGESSESMKPYCEIQDVRVSPKKVAEPLGAAPLDYVVLWEDATLPGRLSEQAARAQVDQEFCRPSEVCRDKFRPSAATSDDDVGVQRESTPCYKSILKNVELGSQFECRFGHSKLPRKEFFAHLCKHDNYSESEGWGSKEEWDCGCLGGEAVEEMRLTDSKLTTSRIVVRNVLPRAKMKAVCKRWDVDPWEKEVEKAYDQTEWEKEMEGMKADEQTHEVEKKRTAEEEEKEQLGYGPGERGGAMGAPDVTASGAPADQQMRKTLFRDGTGVRGAPTDEVGELIAELTTCC